MVTWFPYWKEPASQSTASHPGPCCRWIHGYICITDSHRSEAAIYDPLLLTHSAWTWQWDVTSFWSKLTVFKALAMNVGLGSPMDREQVLIRDCLDGDSASLLGLLQPPGCFLPYICFHSLSLQRPYWSLAILGSRSSLTVFPDHCMPSAVHIIPMNNGKKRRLFHDPRTFSDCGSLKWHLVFKWAVNAFYYGVKLYILMQ